MGSFLRVDRVGDVTRLRMARTVLGRPLYVTACYRVGDVLVDAGCPAARRRVLGHAAARGVRDVLVTHHHEDHGGLAAELGERGARVHASAAARGPLRDGFRVHAYRRVVWGVPRPVDALPLGEAVDAGGRRWRVVPTPGHSPDHVAFLSDEGDAFTGDLFFGRVRTARSDEDVVAVVASLRRLRDLEPARLLPAHRPPVVRPREALDAALDHYESLARRARALASRGHGVRRIRRALLGPERVMHYASLGHFSADHLVRGLLRLPA